ncbi:MAG: amidohydrolase family protein, partial [Novosphingobium sp.]
MAVVLIRGAEVGQLGITDVRLAGGKIAAIGPLVAEPGEPVIEAKGGALLPGLHDHHIHLTASAARKASIVCGPPEVVTAQDLAARLSVPGDCWLRGILYHESVMGLPDAAALDHFTPHRPVRIQHRSGRMWLLNSRALDLLLAASAPPAGMERNDGRFTGRLFDEDAWLQAALASHPPDLAEISQELARYGVTGVTDMSPRNDPVIAAHFSRQVASGAVLQHCTLAGSLSLAQAEPSPHWHLGPAKLHLHEAAMPDFDETVAFIRAAHAQARALAS